MRHTILVTGAASGIGQAVVRRLRAAGDRVIGTDLRNAEIDADLSNPDGRARLIDAAGGLCPDGLDGVIACAGVALSPPEQMISINYFGAVAVVAGLRALLAKRPAGNAVLIASSAILLPTNAATVAACLGNDETAARAAALADPDTAYASSKRALALWLRRAATGEEWAGQGIMLNAVAPGVVKTPMTAPILATEEGRAQLRATAPIAVADYATPDVIAEAVTFLAKLTGRYLLGQVIFIDGGADALMRPAET